MDARSLLDYLANAESEAVITLPVIIEAYPNLASSVFYQQLSAIFSSKKFKRLHVEGFDKLTVDNIETSKEGLLNLLKCDIAHLHFDFAGHVEIANIYYDTLKEFIHQLKQMNAVFPLLTCSLSEDKAGKYNLLFYDLTINRLSNIAKKVDVALMLVSLGQAAEDQHHGEEALAFYNLAAQQFPQNKLVHYYRGWFYSKDITRLGLALVDFNQIFRCLALAPDKNYEECALFARGNLFIKISETEFTEKLHYLLLAKQDFETLLALKEFINVENKNCYQKRLAVVEDMIKFLQSPLTQHATTLFSTNDSEEDICIPDEALGLRPIY